MPFPDELLKPIEGANPSGTNLRYDPVFDKIKEARREEDQPPPGMTERDRKVADNPLVIKLATDLLTNKTKDLQVAAWLTEAMLKQKGFAGLKDGLALCNGLVEKFWDTLYPEIEDGDAQSRGAPLGFIGLKLDIPLKLVPAVEKARYGILDYQQSRDVGYDDQAKSDDAKKKRAQAIKEGKVAPEDFDKAFEETPKKFYAQAEQDLDAGLQNLALLKKTCDAKFGEDGPSFGPLQTALELTRHTIHGFLQKKREKEPDPVEVVPAVATSEAGSEGAAAESGLPAASVLVSLASSSEPPDRVEAVRKVAEAAAFLRKREPKSPASYLMLRGLRWGELRAAIENSDPTQLEAPPTELRRHLKRLSLDKKYQQLLDAAENAMALPCSRAWLDLQRLVVEACDALGSDYAAIAQAIRSELKALVTDIPQLLDATLMDDTPAANQETRAWLKSLQGVPDQPAAAEASAQPSVNGDGLGSKWPGRPSDAYVAALQALREGQERKAFEILQQDIARKRSGRERFRRRMQLVEMCTTTNKPTIAQPILDDLAAAIETHKLDEWEDPAVVASALSTIMRMSSKIQADKAQQQKIFERICRLDPAQALGNGK
ncbi:MAG TPA: type VI secretion system protein TssA [Candidatus Sulfotelmatobacter sp.]|nr:type VI secretion system protein TssA [Candidatus Sulfotelmatobacter sp.]